MGGGKASAPTPPPPVKAEPAPTEDNSAEVAKQKAIEDARAARVKGLTATDLADNKEVDTTEKTKETTLLGA
ncbi:MAG: hypothetical protein C0446_08285 [Chitinophaga sp.]|nr:hypothetical protein [Chitinophaga sp.]